VRWRCGEEQCSDVDAQGIAGGCDGLGLPHQPGSVRSCRKLLGEGARGVQHEREAAEMRDLNASQNGMVWGGMAGRQLG
jgi:hypothetical protein